MSHPDYTFPPASGYRPDQIAKNFVSVGARGEGDGSHHGSFSTITLPSLQHPGVILAEADGIALFCLAREDKQMVLGLLVAHRHVSEDSHLLWRGAMTPTMCLVCDEQTSLDLQPLYVEIMHRLVELRHRGWTMRLSEEVRVSFADWDFRMELINPLTDKVVLSSRLYLRERSWYRHGRRPTSLAKARQSLTRMAEALDALPTQPMGISRDSRRERLQRAQEQAQDVLSEHVAEGRLRLAISDLLASHPEAEVEQLVEQAMRQQVSQRN